MAVGIHTLVQNADDDDFAAADAKTDKVVPRLDSKQARGGGNWTSQRAVLQKRVSNGSELGDILISLLLIPLVISVGPNFVELGAGLGRKP